MFLCLRESGLIIISPESGGRGGGANLGKMGGASGELVADLKP